MASANQLQGLMSFARRGGWASAMDEALGDHLGVALDTVRLDIGDIAHLLGEQWLATLWGCAFEDLMTRRLAPDGRNIVEAYLKRHGGKENAAARAYMEALAASVFSLYEVDEIVLEQSFRARDLILGGEPVLVHEVSATRGLEPGSKIAARLVRIGERTGIGGGLLPFDDEMSALLLEGLRQALLDAAGPKGETPIALDSAVLQRTAPLLTTVWLLRQLQRAVETMPDFVNADGEEQMLHRIRYPLAKGVRVSDIVGRLTAIEALSLDHEGAWNWLEDTVRTPPSEADRSIIEAISNDGRIILGHVELQGRALLVTVASVSRAERARALVEDALGDRLQPPTVEIQTLDDEDI